MLKEMVTLHEITHALESSDNLDSLLEYIMQKSQNVMSAEAASLMLVVEETNELEFKVTLGPKATAPKRRRVAAHAELAPEAGQQQHVRQGVDRRQIGLEPESIAGVVVEQADAVASRHPRPVDQQADRRHGKSFSADKPPQRFPLGIGHGTRFSGFDRFDLVDCRP